MLVKLLLDACSKTAFSFNKNFYELIDGVSMGSPLGPSTANIIMTEPEHVVLKILFNKGHLKFYVRYMNDMLVLMIKSAAHIVLQGFNGFHKKSEFYS